MLQHSLDVLTDHTGKPLEEIVAARSGTAVRDSGVP
jgi:hypothetical protein